MQIEDPMWDFDREFDFTPEMWEFQKNTNPQALPSLGSIDGNREGLLIVGIIFGTILVIGVGSLYLTYWVGKKLVKGAGIDAAAEA